MPGARRGAPVLRALALLALLGLASGCLAPGAPPPVAAPPRFEVTDCFWSGSFQFDGARDGYAGIDRNAFYALAFPPANDPGAHVELRGEFPDARYFGLQSYAQPHMTGIDALHDAAMVPDPGSANPFAGHAWRAGLGYAMRVWDVPPGERPAQRPANTLYGGYDQGGNATRQDVLEYRVYVPDRSVNGAGIVPGDAPLPRAFYVLDNASAAQHANHDAFCAAARGNDRFASASDGIFGQLAGPAAVLGQPAAVAADPPQWLATAGTNRSVPLLNLEAGYMVALVDPAYGEVLALHLRLPSFARSAADSDAMQVRYWSLCAVQGADFTNTLACLRDDELRPDAQGNVTIAVSAPEHRPVVDGAPWHDWLPYPGSAPFLFLRQVVPNPASFPQSAAFVADTGGPGMVREMGPYYPAGAYCTQARFQLDRCPALRAP